MADMKDRVKTGIDTLADAGKKAADHAPDLVNRVAENASHVAERVQDKARQFAATMQEKANTIADRVSETAHQGMHAAEAASEKMQEYGQDVADLVKRYPFHAMMFGFGLGFLLSRACR